MNPNAQLLVDSLVSSAEGEGPDRRAVVSLNDVDSDRFRAYCSRERLTPLLVHAVSIGRLLMDQEVTQSLWQGLPSVLTTSLLIEEAALSTIEILEAGDVEVRVLKGLATAHLDYPNPSLRQFGDADLLVRPRDFDRALELLSEQGVRRSNPVRGNRWEVQHAIAIDCGGIEIDLHHRLLHGAAGHLAAKMNLFDEPAKFVIGGQTVLALPRFLRLLQAAGQNVLTRAPDRKASSDVDVILLADAVNDAHEAARVAGLGWLVDMGVSHARTRFGLPMVDPVGSGRFRSRLVSSCYRTGEWSTARAFFTELAVAPTSAKHGLIRSAVVPGDEFLVARGRSRRQQLAHQLTRAMSGKP